MTVTGFRIHQWSGDLQRDEFALRKPGHDEALVKVEACGIGLTVLNCIRGDLANETAYLPRVPGHEIVGRVEAVGPGVSSLSVGQRVMAYFYLVCGNCEACRAGQDSLCRRLEGWVGVHRDGGYAPYTVLPARNLVPVPESIPAALATAIPDAIATPLHVCKTRARIQPGDRVAVIGAGGGVGIHMTEMAALYGGSIAGLEYTEAKFDIITKMGATPVLSRSFDDIDLHQVWNGSDPTVVIDLLGSTESLTWAMNVLALGGRLVVLTTFRDVAVPLSPRELVLREITVLGSRYASKSELVESATLVATGQIHPVVSRVVPLDGVEDVHQALREGTLIGRGALDWSL
jgi:propanol-preferring alcohol dehydrogenase